MSLLFGKVQQLRKAEVQPKYLVNCASQTINYLVLLRNISFVRHTTEKTSLTHLESYLSTDNMPRLPSTSLFLVNRRLFSSSFRVCRADSHDGPPGWGGRSAKDHAVNRTDQLDVQADSSQESMKQREKGEEGSQGISQKDERNNNQRAKEEHPEAPGPVLGMNDEVSICCCLPELF